MYFYGRTVRKREITKEGGLVGQRFKQQDADPKHQKKRSRWWPHMRKEQHSFWTKTPWSWFGLNWKVVEKQTKTQEKHLCGNFCDSVGRNFQDIVSKNVTSVLCCQRSHRLHDILHHDRYHDVCLYFYLFVQFNFSNTETLHAGTDECVLKLLTCIIHGRFIDWTLMNSVC